MTSFEQELETHGSIIYTNRGVSMLPLLRQDRGVLVIEKRGEGRCAKYDAVLFKRDNGQYILHRILRVLPQGYLIAGDHNTFLERDVTDRMILGVMTQIIRDGKSIRPQDWRYRLYVYLWCAPWPLRMASIRLYRKGRRFLGRIRRRLRRGKGGRQAR